MRIPVFARGANPRFDRAILRKSELYATEQVEHAHADWIDPGDHSKGIICRELLYFGPPSFDPPENKSICIPCVGGEIPGIRFVPPRGEKNPTIPAIHVSALTTAAAGWDWSREQVAS